MKELVEAVAPATASKSVVSDWLKNGATAEEIKKEAVKGTAILERLKVVVDAKFQEQANKDYDPDATERELAFSAGYRKALKDMYRLLHLDI